YNEVETGGDMFAGFLFSALILALDPQLTSNPFRDLLQKLPKKADLIVGTAEAEVPFQFEFDWAEPVNPEPEIHLAKSRLSWSDFYHLKEGSSMLIGQKKINLACALILGTSLESSGGAKKDYLIELILYPAHAKCHTA